MTYIALPKTAGVPITYEDIPWDEAWGNDERERNNRRRREFILPLTSGMRVNSNHFAHESVLANKFKEMPALWGGVYWMCNEVVKNAIEDLEPNTHQFISHKIWTGFGKRNGFDFYIFNICNSIECLNEEKSTIEIDHRQYQENGPIWSFLPSKESKYQNSIYIDGVPSDKHIWMDPRLAHNMRPPIFISDAFCAVLEGHSCRPVSFIEALGGD